MSGPKCGEFSVESNLERELRIRSELQAGIDHAAEELEVLEAKWAVAASKHGDEFPKVPSLGMGRVAEDMTSDALRKTLENLRTQLTRLENELGEAEAVHRIRDLLAKAAASENARVDSSAKLESQTVNAAEIRRQKVYEALTSLLPSIAERERTAVERLGQEVLQKPSGTKFENALLELRLEVQRANRRKKEHEALTMKVDRMLDRLTGLEGSEVSELKQELRLARSGGSKLRPGIDAEVASVAAAASAGEDKRYASKVLIEELVKLGYSVDEGMETVLVNGGELQINNPRLKEYAVQFAVDQQSGRFDVHMVRSSDGAEQVSGERHLRDKSMEATWCGDLAAALASAAARGVETRITKRERPGVVPVVVQRGTQRRHSAPQPRARSMRPAGND